MRKNLLAYLKLINRFLRPSWILLTIMVLANLASTSLMSLRFLALTPALETVLENNQPPATDITALSLNNLGPTILHLLEIDTSEKFHVVIVSAILFFSIHAVAAILDVVGYGFLLIIRNRVRIEMTMWLHRHLINLPLSFFIRSSTGDLTSRAVNDVNTTAGTLDTITQSLFQTSAQILIYLLIMFRTDIKLTSLIILLGTTYLLLARILGPIVHRRGKVIQEQTGLLSQTVMESYQGIRLIKSFSAERLDLKRVRQMIQRVGNTYTRCRFIMHLEVPTRMFADGLVVAILVVATYRYTVLGQHLELSAYALFIGLAMQLVNPISLMSSKFIQLNSMMGGASRIQEIIDIEGDMPDGDRGISPLESNIEFRNVSFSYDAEISILKDINFTIPKGKVLAVVGPSGSGKSTLMDLLLRLQDPTSGQILYDGVDIREFSKRKYHRMFGVVAQESLLMNGSIAYNIVFGRKEDNDRLWQAARIANAEEFIKNSPLGMQTPVGDRGIRLSGGQRQRIGIARAVYAEPPLLILDEATSSLDAESEKEVQIAIANVTSTVTSVVVAHRLATVIHADQILVLANGMVQAIGSHAELLEGCPLYGRLYQLQFAANGSEYAHDSIGVRSQNT